MLQTMICQGQELDLVNVDSAVLWSTAAWNSLPPNLHDLTDTNTFKKRPESGLLSVPIRDILRRSWTFHTAAPYKSYIVLYCIYV